MDLTRDERRVQRAELRGGGRVSAVTPAVGSRALERAGRVTQPRVARLGVDEAPLACARRAGRSSPASCSRSRFPLIFAVGHVVALGPA